MVNLDTATAVEVAGLGIKSSSAMDVLRKCPFLTKEEDASRVTGIGKKTYELIEAKLTMR